MFISQSSKPSSDYPLQQNKIRIHFHALGHYRSWLYSILSPLITVGHPHSSLPTLAYFCLTTLNYSPLDQWSLSGILMLVASFCFIVWLPQLKNKKKAYLNIINYDDCNNVVVSRQKFVLCLLCSCCLKPHQTYRRSSINIF